MINVKCVNVPIQSESDICVMVVDDQKTMRSIVKSLLKQIGIQNVIEAANGVEAMMLLEETGALLPDVIMSDMHMDSMDGVQFCNKLRLSKTSQIREIPFVLLTGETDRMLLETCEQVGACTVLNKPVAATVLRNTLERVVGYSFQ